MAKARDSNDDQFWVALQQLIWREAKPFERAWPKILYENMRVIKKFAQQCEVFFVFEVECDVAFVAIDKFPPQALAIAWVAPGHTSQRVSSVGALYFDDVCAEVGKVARAVWARQDGGNIDNSKIGKWRGHE